MAEVTPTIAKPYGGTTPQNEYTPQAARGWQNSIGAMTGATTFGNHVPNVQILSELQRETLMSADVLNEMNYQYWRVAGPDEREDLSDGPHERDGGKFTIKDGRVASLTTATGDSFTDIKRDGYGNIVSMKTSDGYTWEQHSYVGPDGMLKQDGYDLKLSNLNLRYDLLVVNSKGVTFLNSGKPGYVNTTTISGARGTMSVSRLGELNGYCITLPNGKQFQHTPAPMRIHN